MEVDYAGVGDDERITYQWYKVDGEAGGKAIDGARSSEYILEKNLSAGTYTYYCVVTRSLADDSDVKATKQSDNMTVKIEKIDPEENMFEYEIPSTMYYTGKVQTIPIEVKSGIVGMGTVTICGVKDGHTEDLDQEGEYELQILVANDGVNYNGKKFKLEEKVTIGRIDTPVNPYTIRGTKGNEKDGTQWYTSDVTIHPRSGYQIGTQEDGEFLDVLTYSEKQADSLYPEYIYLRQKNGAITNKISIDKFRVDTTPPTGEFKIGAKNLAPDEGEEKIYLNNTAGITIEPVGDDFCSKEDVECSWYVSARLLSNPNTASNWTSGKEVTVADNREQFYLYARLVDQAGNKGYIPTAEIIVDKNPPEIFCEGKKLKDNRMKRNLPQRTRT